MTRKRQPAPADPQGGKAPTARGFRRGAEPRLAEANPERPRKTAPEREAARLRREAEHRLWNSPVAHSKPHPPDPPTPVEDPQRLLHELQVHQIELEMQQGSLQEARDGLETLLARYTHLYDFAPVGYFTLDPEGRMLAVNLTGAHLLGVDRSALIGRPLQQYLLPASQAGFADFLALVFTGRRQHCCAVTLLKASGKPLPAHLHGSRDSPSSLRTPDLPWNQFEPIWR